MPALLVVTVVTVPCSTLWSCTSAPATIAPAGSLTSPEIVPVSVCPYATPATAHTNTKSRHQDPAIRPNTIRHVLHVSVCPRHGKNSPFGLAIHWIQFLDAANRKENGRCSRPICSGMIRSAAEIGVEDLPATRFRRVLV